jgi:hypothetical protein
LGELANNTYNDGMIKAKNPYFSMLLFHERGIFSPTAFLLMGIKFFDLFFAFQIACEGCKKKPCAQCKHNYSLIASTTYLIYDPLWTFRGGAFYFGKAPILDSVIF